MKKLSKGAKLAVLLTGIGVIILVTAILFFDRVALSPQQLSGLAERSNMQLPTKETGAPCQCVLYVTNSLFGLDNIVTEGTWINAKDLASNQYWQNAYDQKLSYKNTDVDLYTQVPSPVTAKPGDVIIMRDDARIYVQMTNGLWDYLTTIGSGSGHIGFVVTAFYYNGDFNLTTANQQKLTGQSGWLITMRSANWGTEYDAKGLTYPELYTAQSPNVYSTGGVSFLDPQKGCSNVSDSVIFVPSGNPVSFFRAQA